MEFSTARWESAEGGRDDYTLVVEPSEHMGRDNEWGRVFFRTPYGFVTGRDWSEYDFHRQLPLIESTKRYVEVGAGLGGFIEHAIATANFPQDNLPVVIDPVNYDRMHDVLTDFMRQISKWNLSDNTIQRVRSLRDRAAVCIEKRAVRIIPMELSHALKEHPELLGSADAVIAHRTRATSYDCKRLVSPTGICLRA